MKENLKYSLQGGQVYHWQVEGQVEPVLFCSKNAIFRKGKSIRGGAPICWPWFGPRKDAVQHGYARTTEWELVHDYVKNDIRYIQLILESDEVSRALFPFDYSVTMDVIEEKNNLLLSLSTINHSSNPMPITAALHTYFEISHLDKLFVEGLQNLNFIDKTDNGRMKTQMEEKLNLTKEEDRIYVEAPVTKLIDQGYERTITISHNAPNIVLWNPGAEKVHLFDDLDANDYQKFICIESGQVTEPKIIQPKEEWLLEQNILVD